MKEIIVKAREDNIEKVTSFVEEQLEQVECPIKIQTQIDIAIDELFGNIARYAYDKEEGDVTIRVELIDDMSTVKISFVDNGKPFNPLEKEDPDTTLSIEDREIGGLGIYMVKKTMDEVSYEYKDKKNNFMIKKRLIL